MKRKRHGVEEIAAKLQLADEMAAAGKLQSEIARALGVSVMTYHRWRKMPELARQDRGRGPQDRSRETTTPLPKPSISPSEESKIDELKLENSRLRRLVTDLMLEKMKLDEILQGNNGLVRRDRK